MKGVSATKTCPYCTSRVRLEELNLCSLLTGALVYEQLGYKAFGMPGKLAASCSITMQNIGGKALSCCLIDLSLCKYNKIVFAPISWCRVKKILNK